MAILLGIALSSLLFEDEDLVALHVLEDLARHGNATHSRGANIYCSSVICQEDFVEAHRCACLSLHFWSVDILVFSHFELFAGNVYNCVHSFFEKIGLQR